MFPVLSATYVVHLEGEGASAATALTTKTGGP